MVAHVANTTEFELVTDDGIPLFVRDWHPQTHPESSEQRHGVVIMHGLSEHCGRYIHVARFFTDLGFVVRTYDQRGHGQSGGAIGDVPDDEAFLRDAEMIINDFAKLLTEPPLLLAHSMGGLFAARFATAGLAPLRGLILSSPALALPLTGFQRALHKLASRVAPGYAVPNGFSTSYLTHDEAVIEAYDNDPLVHARISARLLTAMLHAMDYAHDHATHLRIPVLMVVADDDHIVDSEGSKRFFARLPTEYATGHFYQGFYHEVLNEADAERVFADIRQWLSDRQLLP